MLNSHDVVRENLIRIRYLLPCLFFFLSPGLLSFTIQDVVDAIKKNNTDIKIAEKDRMIADAELDSAKSRRLPTLTLSSTMTHLNEDVVLDVENKRIERDILGGRLSVSIDVDPPPLKIQDQDILRSHLLLTQPLYAGGRIDAGVKASSAKVEETRFQSEGVLSDKIFEGLSRYYSLILTQALAAVLKRMEADALGLENIAKASVASGVSPKLALLQVRAALSEIRAKMATLSAKSGVVESALLITMGISSAEKTKIGADFRQRVTLPEPSLGGTLNEFVEKSLKKRPEFGIVQAKLEQVQALIAAENGKAYPTVYGFGKYELYQDNLTLLEPEWAVGLGIDIPLSSSLTQSGDRLRARRMQEKVKALSEKARSEIPLSVENIFAEVQGLQQSLLAQKDATSLAEEAHRIVTLRYKAGAGSAAEVLKSAADFERIETERLRIQETYVKKFIELYQVTGSIEEALPHLH